ncbi:MAG: hydrogenase maturation protease [Chloroflexota bacterium]|nr:hydrogenase maturation protease [Chloroflexota bacterium]
MANERMVVIGLGNPLRGDDGVGSRVVEELTHRGLPPGVEVLDGGAIGLGLLDLMEGWERVIIVDAAEMGREPGEFVRFTPADALLASRPDSFSFHHAGLSETLALAEALGRTIPEMVIFGVQPAEVGWGEGLSQAVGAALPALIDAVLDEINDEINDPPVDSEPVGGGQRNEGEKPCRKSW